MHYFKLRDIKFNRDSDSETGKADNGDRESGEAAASKNQNLRETEGSDANKIEAGTK